MRGQGGFTLLELLVTMAVTVIGLLGLMAMYVATVKGNEATARSGAAVTIAQQTLEEMRSSSVAALKIRYGTSQLQTGVALNTVAGRDGTTYNRLIQADSLTGAPDLVKLRVEVTWTEDKNVAVGAASGAYDHHVGLEIIRTATEGL